MVSMIWAMDKNWLIGKDNILPWHYKEDLVYFKEHTIGKTVLMGDLTYESLKGYYKDKPLPYGKIYVANLVDKEYPDATLVKNLDEFFKNLKEDLIVIGGKTIYSLSLPYADKLFITHINKEYEGNVYFKKFPLEEDFKLISKNDVGELSFCVYERI